MKRTLSIGLLILIIVYLLFGISIPGNRTAGPKDMEASETIDYSFQTSGSVLLSMDRIAGSVTINASPADVVSVVAVKNGKGATQDEARNELKKIKADVKQEGQTLIFTTETSEKSFFGDPPDSFNTVDYIIHAPEGTGLKIKQGSGSVITKYVKGSVDLTGTKLDLLLNDLRGDVAIHSESGSIRLTNVVGNVLIDSKTAPVRLERANGPAISASSSGAIFLKDTGAEGDMKITAGSGELTMDRTKARTLQITAPTGEVSITDTTTDEMLTITGGEGSVFLNRGNYNPLKVETKSGQVTLKEVQGGIDIKTSSGGVDIRQATATSLKIITGAGDVLFGGKIPESGEASVSTAKGGIQLFFARETPFKLDAVTGTGSVTFSIPVTLEGQEKSENHLKGTANSGSAILSLKSVNGDIRLSSRLPW